VLLRVLTDLGALQTPSGHLAIGWLMVEDVFTVLVLLILPVTAGHASRPGFGAILAAVGLAALKLVALVVFTLVVGRRLIPILRAPRAP
jgi:CPA2 family monovalent cation:H+ antiporter-2